MGSTEPIHVLISGGTGMIGSLILEECLKSPRIGRVEVLVRRRSERSHPKLREWPVPDFADYSGLPEPFLQISAAFFCLGAYTGQVPDREFKRITVDYAVAFAAALRAQSPNATLCLLSGQGADRSAQSRIPFARYKGIAESEIAALELGAFYAFRPSYIFPVSPRREPNLMYRVMRRLYPLVRLLGKNFSIRSTDLAAAMFRAGLDGAEKEILENRDILAMVPGQA